MKHALLLLTILISFEAGAQHFWVGARSGVSYWTGQQLSAEPFTNQNVPVKTTQWEKEAFLRYQSAGHFAYELGINQVSAERPSEVYALCGVGLVPGSEYTSARKVKDIYYGINLRLQYRPGDGDKKLRHYAGIVLTPTLYLANETETFRYIEQPDRARTATYCRQDIELHYGAEYTVRYRIGRRLDIHSLIGYKFNDNGLRLNRAFALQGGIDYSL